MNNKQPDSKRELDYTQSQFGADSMRTQNTSSDYSKDVQDHRQVRGTSSDLHNESLRDTSALPNSEAEETFLDDYRSHHGLPAIPHKRSRFEPDDNFEFKHNADYGSYYTARKDQGFFVSLKGSIRNFFNKGSKRSIQ